MKVNVFAADPLFCSRATATRDQLQLACQAMANDEYGDHAIAAMLELDVETVRQAIGRCVVDFQ